MDRGCAGAGPGRTSGHLHGSHRPLPPVVPTGPPASARGGPRCGGGMGGMSWGPRNWWPALQSQGPEELSSCWVLHVGVRLPWPQSFRGHQKMLRARASEQAEGAQLKTQSWNGLPGTGRLDRIRATGSPGHSLPLDMLGTGAGPEPGLDKNSQKHLLMLRETPASTARPVPRASSKHQGRSLAAGHHAAGLGLAQRGLPRPRGGGPGAWVVQPRSPRWAPRHRAQADLDIRAGQGAVTWAVAGQGAHPRRKDWPPLEGQAGLGHVLC